MFEPIAAPTNQFRFCLPIVAPTLADADRRIQALASNFEFFEIWLDYISDIAPADLVNIAGSYPGRLVFHFRRERQAPICTPLAKRIEIITALAKQDLFIDLDVTYQSAEIALFTKMEPRNQLIVSFHDFDRTPSIDQLLELALNMVEVGADCVKIATFCEDPSAAARLINLTRELEERKIRHIVAGMGIEGRIVRVVSALWGNVMNFAPDARAQSSAPGQLTQRELCTILTELGAK